MFILMMAGVPIAFALGFSALCAGLFFYGDTVLAKLGMGPFRFMYNVAWTPLPLFVLLGTLMAETRIGDDLFGAASKWLSRVPGGLVAGSIVGEGVMAAVIGTSAATVVVVGKTAVPAFEKHGYNRKMGLGALLAGGVLGPLIPPSATMIIYGVLAEMSIGQLFIAGIIPGIILIAMLAIPTILWCWWKPNWGPPGRSYSWGEINCTDCGPRYTIIKSLPYDRPNTTMLKFKMCPDCNKEYSNPSDRRFHAQPVCCPNCGPVLRLLDCDGKDINSENPAKKSSSLLDNGKIIAVKGIGVFT